MQHAKQPKAKKPKKIMLLANHQLSMFVANARKLNPKADLETLKQSILSRIRSEFSVGPLSIEYQRYSRVIDNILGILNEGETSNQAEHQPR